MYHVHKEWKKRGEVGGETILSFMALTPFLPPLSLSPDSFKEIFSPGHRLWFLFEVEFSFIQKLNYEQAQLSIFFLVVPLIVFYSENTTEQFNSIQKCFYKVVSSQ